MSCLHTRQVDTSATVAAAAALTLPQSSEKLLATVKRKQHGNTYKLDGIGQVVVTYLPITLYKAKL